MATISWHAAVMMGALALLVTSSWTMPLPSDEAIVFLDEQFHADPSQYRPPGLPSALPLESESEGRSAPHYPPFGPSLDLEKNETQEYIDTQLHPMVQVYADMQRLQELERIQQLLNNRSPEQDLENEIP